MRSHALLTHKTSPVPYLPFPVQQRPVISSLSESGYVLAATSITCLLFFLEYVVTAPQRTGLRLVLSSSNSASDADMALNIASIRDTKWLTLEVCRQFQRGTCSRSDEECKFAHPSKSCQVENGRVIACFDSLKVSIFFYNIIVSCITQPRRASEDCKVSRVKRTI